jgi:hypothetical protein
MEDEVVACIHFAEEYANRYGDTHPLFFQGSLDDAVKEACNKPAKEVCHYIKYDCDKNLTLLHLNLNML